MENEKEFLLNRFGYIFLGIYALTVDFSKTNELYMPNK